MRKILLKDIPAVNVSDLNESFKSLGYFQSRDYGWDLVEYVTSIVFMRSTGNLPITIYNLQMLEDTEIKKLIFEYLI